MKCFSFFTDPNIVLNLIKDNNVVYIDSIPYKGINLYEKVNLKKINKTKVKTLKKINK